MPLFVSKSEAITLSCAGRLVRIEPATEDCELNAKAVTFHAPWPSGIGVWIKSSRFEFELWLAPVARHV